MYAKVSTWLILVLFNVACQQPADQRTAKRTTDAEAEWSERAANIQTEIDANPHHLWAGTYFSGDDSVHALLFVHPNKGFVLHWRGCMGDMELNYGDIEITNHGTIKLKPVLENIRQGSQGVAEEFIPVPWGERRYLIAVDEVAEFCSAVNDGSEPRFRERGLQFIRRGDHEKTAAGQPTLPEKYIALLLAAPIIAEIVSVEPARMEEGVAGIRFQRTKATLKFTGPGKLAPGMSLQIAEPSDFQCMGKAEVQSVDADTAEVLITQPVNDRFPPLPPAVGWKLTTGSRPPPRAPFRQTPK